MHNKEITARNTIVLKRKSERPGRKQELPVIRNAPSQDGEESVMKAYKDRTREELLALKGELEQQLGHAAAGQITDHGGFLL